jgi:phosphatidylglycerophosphatase A
VDAVSDLTLKPSWRFVLSRPAHFIAFGFGAGLIPVAPGTFGTLLALPLYWLFQPQVAPLEFLLLIALFFGLGVWACEMTGRALGVHDHGGIVWDEVVAFLLVLAFTRDLQPVLVWQAAAFVLFRAFDILKPPPIRHFDRTLKSGFGAMFDDLLAALYTLIILAVARMIIE